MSGEAPGQAARTPGQAAYEAWFGNPAADWNGRLNTFQQAGWERIAQAGIAAYIEANGDPVDVRAVISEATGLPVVEVTRDAAQEQPAPGPRLVALDPAVLHQEVRRLSELLDEIGVMAANADEDGDCWAVLEEIAMRIGAAEAELLREAGPATDAMHRVRELTSGILGVAENLEQSAAATAPSAKSRAEAAAAKMIRRLLDVQ